MGLDLIPSGTLTADPGIGWAQPDKGMAGLRVSCGFNCQTATALQTYVIAPIVCGAGAPSCFAFPPSWKRACGTPGARCTLGP